MYGDAVPLITYEMLQGLSVAIMRLLIALGIVLMVNALTYVHRHAFILIQAFTLILLILVAGLWGIW